MTLTLTGTNGAGGPVTDHATTNASGAYIFTEAPGTYTVSGGRQQPAGGTLAGYAPTPALQGSDRSIDSNPNPAAPRRRRCPRRQRSTVDFGYYKPVTIGDFVWNDTNGNGIQDAGEPGISGVTVTLSGTNAGRGSGDRDDDHGGQRGLRFSRRRRARIA